MGDMAEGKVTMIYWVRCELSSGIQKTDIWDNIEYTDGKFFLLAAIGLFCPATLATMQ